LPEPFDGLGLQLNYTYIKSEGVPNFSGSADPVTDPEAGDPEIDTDALAQYDGLPLRGQSKDTYNIVGMYEKAGWSLRLAYNWRSRYLMTTRDVISKHPIWNDDAGFLDGSIFYDVTDDIQVGMQFTNLLDTQTKTIMILDNEGREADRSWFVNDRRAAFVFRANF
jgi:iron complex outermembrane receptor protein